MKSGISFGVKTLLLIIICFSFLNSCKDDTVTVDNPIADLKGSDWRENIGEIVTLEAYLLLDPVPTLLFDMEDLMKNQVTPEDRYMRLSIPQGLLSDLGEQYHGARVSVRGTISQDQSGEAETMQSLLGDSYACFIDVLDFPELVEASDILYPYHVNPCIANPQICDQLTINERQTYVMIFSGGINSGSAHMRYWNDMVFFHFTLTWILGVDASNIKVVYKNGVGEDGYMPVNYAASISGVNDAFEWFEEEMDANDRFVFYATNHGGHNYSDGNNDELDNDDEAIFYYNESSVIRDDLLATLINGLTFDEFIGILEPCFAGGLIRDLSGTDRVIMSASTEDQVSWGGLTNYGNSYDHFVFFFTSALAGQYPDGTAVDADTDNNGKVSMAEAFEYARVADTTDELPQIDSDGNGNPSSTAGGESGSLAENMYIAD